MTTKTLLLLRGFPGCGKTTIAQMLSDHAYAADDWMVDSEGVYTFDPTRLGYCHGRCMQSVQEDMEAGVSLIAVHNTFVTRREMKPYFRLAAANNYRVHVLHVEFFHDGVNSHGVPPEYFEHRPRKWQPADKYLRALKEADNGRS